MAEAKIEHVNITVKSPMATAEKLMALFGWEIRWQGDAINGGLSVHVGGVDTYVALYNQGGSEEIVARGDTHTQLAGLNHLGVVVDDLDETERRVKAAGFTTYSHGDYEPGRRFYFDDNEGLEIEVVSYNVKAH